MTKSVEAAGSIIVPNFASAFSYDVVSSLTALFRAIDRRKNLANRVIDSEVFKAVYGVSVALEQLIKTVECAPVEKVQDKRPAPLSYEGHWSYLILYAMASVIKDETRLWETRITNFKTLTNLPGELLERASAVLIALERMEEATESLMYQDYITQLGGAE